MSIETADPTLQRPALIPGKKYRFHARTAEEAVKIIHERMGPKARVINVEQVGGQGLGRLLGGSKLEVIAVIPMEQKAAPKPDFGTAAESSEKELPGKAVPPPTRRRAYDFSEDEKPLVEGGRDLRAILKRLGFSSEVMGRFANSIDPREFGSHGWAGKFDAFIAFLWNQYRALPTKPLTGQVAFFGPPGCGITTALCKELTSAVFIRSEQPVVSSLELNDANATESLRAFCELMQVPLVSEQRAALNPTERVFWDVPGISSRDFDTWREVGGRLDDLEVRTRVLVAHAAFDTQHLFDLLRSAEVARPTHLIFTHVDEASQPARLWDPLLKSGLSPLFVSESPSVTGGRRDDFHAALLAQTFPAHLKARVS